MTRLIAFAGLFVLLALAGCKKMAPPDDKALVQGEWEIVAVDVPPETTPEDRREIEVFKEVQVRVEGDHVILTHPKEKGRLAADITLDQTKTPQELDLINATTTHDDVAKPQAIEGTTRGIYKLTGDELVIALPLGDGNLPRPTEFKPMADKVNHRGVLVFHLKKKK